MILEEISIPYVHLWASQGQKCAQCHCTRTFLLLGTLHLPTNYGASSIRCCFLVTLLSAVYWTGTLQIQWVPHVQITSTDNHLKRISTLEVNAKLALLVEAKFARSFYTSHCRFPCSHHNSHHLICNGTMFKILHQFAILTSATIAFLCLMRRGSWRGLVLM